MPICILECIYRQCLQRGLNPDDAHDCVTEVCLRYRKRTGAFPHDEATPNLRLLRLLTLNVVREFQRAQQRRQRLEHDYLALQRQQQASAPTPMAQAIARVDCERFCAQLPDYLRRTLEQMEAGDTPKAIAAQLGVAVGTVYSYQRELRERFVAFFGYDPRKSGVRVVNYSGYSEASSSDDTQEVQNDATAEDAWCSGVVVSGSEPNCTARHPDRSGSDDWRGGAAMAPAMSSGCGGCKQTMTNISQTSIKAVLNNQQYIPMRAIRCHCLNPKNPRSEKQWWCPSKHWLEELCDYYLGKPDGDGDGTPHERNYLQVRTREIVECNGNTYVTCSGWAWTSKCCSDSAAEPSCIAGVRGPGNIILCSEIVFSAQ